MSEEEHQLAGGNVTQPSRIGDHVHRNVGPWTPTIHALLAQLEAVGFDGAPRVVGRDELGREVLTYIEGESGSDGFPQALHSNDGLVAFGAFIRRFHDAVRDFDPGPDAEYRIGPKQLRPGEVVCHGDLGYWNTVWRDDAIVGLIDWDFAEPAAPIHDVALAAMSTVPFLGNEHLGRFGLPSEVDRRARLAAIARGYGDVSPGEIVEAATTGIRGEIGRLQSFAAAGREPWATNLERGQMKLFEALADWIDEHGSSLA